MGIRMVMMVVLVMAGDFAAIEGLMRQDQWANIWSTLWLSLISLAPGLYGAHQGLGWMACESAWAEPTSERTPGNPHGLPGAVVAGSAMRMLSGVGILFAALTLFLRFGLDENWFNNYPKLSFYFIFMWFRLAPLGLTAPFWAALLAIVGQGRAILHGLVSALSSALGWYILWDLFGANWNDFWHIIAYFLAYFPTYGFALSWGGALWWLPSRLGGEGKPPGPEAIAV